MFTRPSARVGRLALVAIVTALLLAEAGCGSRPNAPSGNARRRSFAERMNELIDPAVKKGGKADQAVENLVDAEEGSRAVMQLSQYEVELSGPEGKRILTLTSRIAALRPSDKSTVSRAGEPYERGCRAVSDALRKKFRSGEPLSRDLREQVKILDTSSAKQFQKAELPDLESLALRNELTADHLLPYLFHLRDQANYIKLHRRRDAKLHAAVLAFEKDRERLAILHKMHYRQEREIWEDDVLLNYAAADKAFDLNNRFFGIKPHHARTVAEGRYADFGPYLDDPFEYFDVNSFRYLSNDKRWQALCKEQLFPYALKRESERQTRMSRVFTEADASAMKDLAALQKAQDEMQLVFSELVPAFRYRFRPILKLDNDGNPKEEPLAPLRFEADPKSYVVPGIFVRLSGGKRLAIGYTVEI